MSAAFERYIGIDYSGSETCESGLKGLRVHTGVRAARSRAASQPPARIGRARRLLIGSLNDDRDSHQQDAYATAEWLRRSDLDGTLERFFSASLTDHELKVSRNRRLDSGDHLMETVGADDTLASP